MTRVMAGPSRTIVAVDGQPVLVNRAGEGNADAVLFLHGSGPGATAFSNWRYTLPVIGERFDAIAPDLLGFGESFHPDPPPVDVRVWSRMRVRQILGLMDVLGLERVSLVGNSMGGRIALEMLMWAPERFNRVVLMGSVGAPMTPTTELRRMMTFYQDPTPQNMAALISWFVYDDDTFGGRLDEIAEERFAAAMRPDVRRSFEATFTPPLDLTLPDSALRRIGHPVLLIHGRDDAFVPLAQSEHLSGQLPDNRLHVFGRCGHWVQIEHSDAFNFLVGGFLEGQL